MGVQTAITDLATDPREWFRFDGSGTGQTNYGSDGGTWSAYGTNTWSQSGSNAVDGSAVLGTTGYYSANMRIASNTSTFAFWFKRSSAPSVDTKFINWFYDSTYNNDATTENAITTAGKVKWGPRYGASPTAAVSNTNVCDGNWHFIVLTRNGTTVKIYIDGAYETSGTVGSSNSSTLTSTVDFGLADGGNNYYDEFFMCDYVLSDAEIESIWDASPFAAVNVTVTDTAGMATSSPHAVFADPAISVQTNVQYTADPMLVTNAELPGPVISANAEVSYAADPATASSEAVDPAIATTSNIEYTDTASTASALAVDPTVSAQVYVSIAADPATATADLSNNVFYGMTVQDADYHVEVRQISGTTSNTALTTGSGDIGFQLYEDNPPLVSYYVSIAMKPNSGFPTYNKIVKAKLDPAAFTINGTYDERIKNEYLIYVFTEAPSSNFQSMDYDNLPAKELLYISRNPDDGSNPNSNTDVRIDLTPAFRDPRSHDYGILIETRPLINAGYENSYDRVTFTPTSGNDWRYNSLYILTSDIQLVNVDATPVTASAEMADPSITTINNITLTADVITASAELVEAIASSAQNFEHFDTPWTASSLAVDPTILPEMVYVVGHLEADSLMVNPTLDIEGTYIYYSSEPVGTASAEFMSVGWNIGEENVAVHMDASSEMVDPVIRGDNLQYANEMNGNSALMTDPTITTVLNSQTVIATPMEANVAFPNPVYSRALDPYYSRIRELVGDASNLPGGTPDYLFIFDGLDTDTYGWKPGFINANSTGSNIADFNSYGVTVGGIIPAPGGRRAQSLTNTGVNYTMGSFDSTTRYSGSKSAVEAVLRVSEANAGQFYHRRYISSLGGGTEVKLFINNGKIKFELWSRGTRGGFSLAQSYEGFRNIADGQWHHIVVNFSDDIVNGPNYFDVYIDGERDFKRFQGLGNATKGRWPALVANFTGDIQSIAHYELELSQDDIVKNYYLALDIDAIEAEPMLATATLVNAKKVKGNRQRMLVLYSGFTSTVEGGMRIVDNKEFDYDFGPNVSTFEDITVGQSWGEVDVFTAPILGPWRDPVSDDFRSIDLRTDVNLGDFDIVSFRNYPNETTEFDSINSRDWGGTGGARLRDVWQKERETFARNLLLAINETGTSLYVNDPQLAIDLGIVDRVIQASDFIEIGGSIDDAGNGAGAYDPRSYDIDPFVGNGRGNGATVPNFQGMNFSDTHTLAFHRIVNEIPGITDAASRSGKYYVKELSRYIPYSPFQIDRYSFKYGQAALNEDFYVQNAGLYGTMGGPSYRSGEYGGKGDRSDLIIVPPSNVKAGTIVTAISPTYYNGRTATANPYAGYATTIAIEPGQSISGIQMNAKVFVSFTEPMQSSAPNSNLRYQDQTKPISALPADEIDFMWGGEAANWQYSTWRQSTVLQNVGASYATTLGPNAAKQGEGTAAAGTGQLRNVAGRDVITWVTLNLPVVSIYNNYEEGFYTHFTASNAGWRWLSVPVVINEEDAIIRPSAITAVAEIKEATIALEVNKEIFATVLVAAADIKQPADYILPDTIGLALPMTASAEMESTQKIMRPEPFTVTANIGQNFTITVSGEQVVLTLPHSDAVLYIKEDINN